MEVISKRNSKRLKPLTVYIFCILITIATFYFYSIVLTPSKYVGVRLFGDKDDDTNLRFRNHTAEFSNRTIYVVTPTHRRANQRSLLTMLAHAFRYVENFHWILSEDSKTISPWLHDLLERFRFNFTQIACDRAAYCARHNRCKAVTAKGSIIRNCALMWLKSSAVREGILYFADDDNFYDTQLFEEIRSTKKVSLFPVGGFMKTGLSGPIVKDGKIVDFIDPWKVDRKFPIDMAGFAVNVKFWRQRNAPLFGHVKGYLETRFIQDLNVTRDELELAGSVSKMYVWHNTIQIVRCSKDSALWKSALKHTNTNLDILKKFVDC